MSKSVQQQIGCIALVVENYDDAIEFYTKKLQFTLVEDTDLGGGKTLGSSFTSEFQWNELAAGSSEYSRTIPSCGESNRWSCFLVPAN